MNLPQSRSSRVRGDAGLSNNPPVQLRGIPIVDSDPAIQSRYEEFRRHGNSHNFSEMMAFKQPPGSQSDTDFQRGIGTLASQIGDPENIYLNEVTGTYRKLTGHNPGNREIYMPGLAQFPGDPRAFVASGSEAKRVAERQNLGVTEGSFTNKARQPEVDPFAAMAAPQTKRAPIASDLKNLIADQMVKRDPSLKGRVNPGMLDAVHGNHVKEK